MAEKFYRSFESTIPPHLIYDDEVECRIEESAMDVRPVYILTAEEWAKFQALYRVAESIHSSRDRESFGYISDLEEAIDAIDGGTYNPEIAGDTNADV